jgi:Ca2+-binding EF-hand superfamily protein
MPTFFSKLARYASDNPITASGILVGLGAVGYVLYSVLTPERGTFADKSVQFLADHEFPERMQSLIGAIHESHTEGVFSVNQAAALKKAFEAHASHDEAGRAYLSTETFRSLLVEQGIKNRVLLAKIVRGWDADGDGRISLTEFLHAVAFTLRGTREQKLRYAFAVMDMDSDGNITSDEMRTFLASLLRTTGRDASGVEGIVRSIFRAADTDMDGQLTMAEFLEAGLEHRFHMEEDLLSLVDSIHANLATRLAKQ